MAPRFTNREQFSLWTEVGKICFCFQTLQQVTNVTTAIFLTWTWAWLFFPELRNKLNLWTEVLLLIQLMAATPDYVTPRPTFTAPSTDGSSRSGLPLHWWLFHSWSATVCLPIEAAHCSCRSRIVPSHPQPRIPLWLPAIVSTAVGFLLPSE